MNITVDRAVIEQAVEALERRTYDDFLEWASALKDVRDSLRTALEQPERKPLTDKEILTYRYMIDWTAEWSYINFARAIEAAHGIVNPSTQDRNP